MHDAPPSAHQLVSRAVDLKVLNRFDYKCLSPEVARTLRRTAILILEKLSITTREIVEIGRLLIAVKRTLQRGQFVAWVEAECVFSLRSAQNYMRAARYGDIRSKQNRGLQADESTCGAEQEKKETLNANVRIILDRFGLDGACFLLGIRDDIIETLSMLEKEISGSDELEMEHE
jgi:hypothetical protein